MLVHGLVGAYHSLCCVEHVLIKSQGIVTAMYQIGSVVVIPFIGPAIDTWGRRAAMFMSAFIIILGVIIQGTCIKTENIGQFMGGRFLLGFGVGIIGAAGPTYVVEMSHPAHRGVTTGLYNVFWPVGALVASCAARGGLTYAGTNTSWMIPVWLQMFFPTIIFVFVWLLPESPRWLYVHGRVAEAREILTRYHGQGNPNSEWVKLQMMEYEQHLELDGSDKHWWDYRALFRDRASRNRLMVNCIVSLFGQWAGNGCVSYFLSKFLETANIKGETLQTNLAVGMNAIQIAFAALGASQVDRFGRRPMLIIVNIVCCLCWIAITVSSSIANVRTDSTDAYLATVPGSVSKACLAWVYIFQICYSVGWTPMQALYPVEVLSFEMRAKGMAFSSLFTSVGLLANQFGISVALDVIAWNTYTVFAVWCAVQSVILYFIVPETKNRTVSTVPQPLYLNHHYLQFNLARGAGRNFQRKEPSQSLDPEEEAGGRCECQYRPCGYRCNQWPQSLNGSKESYLMEEKPFYSGDWSGLIWKSEFIAFNNNSSHTISFSCENLFLGSYLSYGML